MSDKLTEIMAWKRRELAPSLRDVSVPELERFNRSLARPPSFAAALRRDDGKLAVIAEIKRRSPSAGEIKAGASAVEQAKRYQAANSIGAATVRDFFGALSLKRATKGIFVTTSSFSQPAIETARGLGSRIVLIEGKHLARLLIHYNVGTRDEEVLRIKKLDEDFFE